MKQLFVLVLILFLGFKSFAQVEYVARFEVETDFFDPLFETIPTNQGLISFRTLSKKAFNNRRTFQYFISDLELNTDGLIELPVRDGFDMVGFDLEGDFFHVLFQRGYSTTGERYVLRIDLSTRKGFEYGLSNLLDMELAEFLVQNNSVIVMGVADTRPAVQVYDLDDKSVHTLQGIYGNDTQILQIRKMPEIESFQVVLSRKGQYREREIIINTYDLEGNLLRDIKVNQFGDPDQEIMEALLLPMRGYQQTMIGSFGLERRDYYQGMYLMDINEFGECETKLYTLEDFPNFFNYLNERSKARKDREVMRNIEKNRVPSIRNVYSIRQAIETPEAYYVYFDHYNIINSRGNFRTPYSPMGMYRYDRFNRFGQNIFDPIYMNRLGSPQFNQLQPEYSYISAHFIKLGKDGKVIWDNAATFDDLNTEIRMAFGDIAVIGDEFYHAYVRDDEIRLAYFKNGEKVFDNLEVEIELMDETQRIAENNMETLSISHWFGRFYLLTGTQRIRYQKEDGSGASKEVFFLSKVMVAGDLYQPEEGQE